MTPSAIDIAFASFQTAEAQLSTDNDALNSANSALTALQTQQATDLATFQQGQATALATIQEAVTTAASAVSADTAAYISSLQALAAEVTAAEAAQPGSGGTALKRLLAKR